MIRKFRLRNLRSHQLATVLYFPTPAFPKLMVGFIIRVDHSEHAINLFENETIDEIVSDLAERIGIQFHDFIQFGADERE